MWALGFRAGGLYRRMKPVCRAVARCCLRRGEERERGGEA